MGAIKADSGAIRVISFRGLVMGRFMGSGVQGGLGFKIAAAA